MSVMNVSPSSVESSIVNMPSFRLKLRKDIWTHFPVIVVPLGRGTDGAERHAIVWHRKKIADMRNSAHSWNETHEQQRLVKCLQENTKWTLEKSTNPAYICVIRMKYAMSNAPASNYESPMIHSPVLTRLTDIKANFPVVWHKIVDMNNQNSPTKVFAIELHRKLIANSSQQKGYDTEDQIVGLLMRALKASTAWRVLQPVEDNEFCRLEMLC